MSELTDKLEDQGQLLDRSHITFPRDVTQGEALEFIAGIYKRIPAQGNYKEERGGLIGENSNYQPSPGTSRICGSIYNEYNIPGVSYRMDTEYISMTSNSPPVFKFLQLDFHARDPEEINSEEIRFWDKIRTATTEYFKDNKTYTPLS
jgi:hypothetical protein